ncbi:MAG TPA: VOC family protein [Polyangiaceae bacterium]|nr:VOC family protein [Polyangiaceae bacterium]
MQVTANLIVDRIEDCLPFWIDRLGFEKSVEVPHEERLGFVILKRGKAELMLQSRASMANDIAPFGADAYRSILYITVEDLEPIRKALKGYPQVVPERTTFYGAQELIVRDPAGNGVCFGAH